MRDLQDSELEKLYKAHQAESHDAGLRAVYAAGYAAAQSADSPQLQPAAEVQAEVQVVTPEEQAIVAAVDSTEPAVPGELEDAPKQGLLAKVFG